MELHNKTVKKLGNLFCGVDLIVLYDGNDIMNYHSHFANETNIAWINSTRSREIKNGIPAVNLIAVTFSLEM